MTLIKWFLGMWKRKPKIDVSEMVKRDVSDQIKNLAKLDASKIWIFSTFMISSVNAKRIKMINRESLSKKYRKLGMKRESFFFSRYVGEISLVVDKNDVTFTIKGLKQFGEIIKGNIDQEEKQWIIDWATEFIKGSK